MMYEKGLVGGHEKIGLLLEKYRRDLQHFYENKFCVKFFRQKSSKFLQKFYIANRLENVKNEGKSFAIFFTLKIF